jgi:transposase
MRVAKDAIPSGNTCMALRDRLGAIFDDALFAPLFPTRGQPAAAPWRLAVVTILQFAERLSDRDAAEAVRTRIDWKYLLGLELSDAGFDYSILSRFRDRLIEGHAEMSLLIGSWINANRWVCCATAVICELTRHMWWLRFAT